MATMKALSEYKRILIGSRAQYHWDKSYSRGGDEKADWDYIDEFDWKPDGKRADCHICPSFKLVGNYFGWPEILPEIGLYTLKLSHCFFRGHWFEKTLFDICYYQKKGYKEPIEELFWPLYKDCELRYGKKKVYLNEENDSFFTDAVKRLYNHDFIHQSVAYDDEPLYLKIKENRGKALTSWNLFLNLSEEDKLKLCREEIYVISIERFLLHEKIPPHVAYLRALKLLLTQLWAGKYALFVATRYLALTEKTEYPWFEKFRDAEKNGKLIKL